jgi:energy-coupling factor transporter transmembrane protein EcfT
MGVDYEHLCILSNIQNDLFAVISCLFFILLVWVVAYIWGHERLSCLQKCIATVSILLIIIFYIDYRKIR